MPVVPDPPAGAVARVLARLLGGGAWQRWAAGALAFNIALG